MAGPTACEVRRPPLQLATEDLARQIEEVDMLLTDLGQRLQPVCVMGPEAPMVESSKRAMPSDPRPPSSSHVDELRNLKSKADGISRRLRKLLEICEV